MFKTMARLFRRHNAAPTPRTEISITNRDPCRVTLQEWRSTPALVQIASKVLRDPEFRLMLDVADRSCPAFWGAFPPQMTLEQRAILQAKIEGYVMALSTLEALGTIATPTEVIESTFGAEETENTTDTTD